MGLILMPRSRAAQHRVWVKKVVPVGKIQETYAVESLKSVTDRMQEGWRVFAIDPCRNCQIDIILHIHGGFSMRADEVEASWDQTKNSWLFRIRIGEEVIRRHCDAPKDTADATLKELVQKTLQDEGFDSELKELKVRR